MPTGNTNQCETTEYHHPQRARRKDAEPITHGGIPLWLLAFLFFIQNFKKER